VIIAVAVELAVSVGSGVQLCAIVGAAFAGFELRLATT
jgi:hypothetical protein